MKRLILIFCADGEAGKALAQTLRNDDTTAQLRDSGGVELRFQIEHCDGVIIMPDVARWKRNILDRVYEGFVMKPPAEPEQDGRAPTGRSIGGDPAFPAFEASNSASPPRPRGRPRKVAA